MAEAFTSLISSIKNFPDFNITVPSFVFIGDESCGKSMLLESIAGLHICSDALQHIRSNVPLLFRIQDHLDPVQPQIITLSYQDRFVDVSHVDKIPNRIYRATKEITENNEITLVLKKKGAPDLFIVDLPEICREPTREKEEFLMKYMSPKETIIVNVVSAKSQFSTCISTKLAQLADPTGCRTLLVIVCTADKEDNMIEEVSALGLRVMGTYYVRQRNRNESYEEANEKEIGLFTTHVELSQIPKSLVGVDLLVRKLVELYTVMQYTWFPIVSSMIEGKLLASLSDLDKVPQNLAGMTGFMLYVISSMKILRDRFIRRDSDEYNTYRIEQHSELLQQLNTSFKSLDKFLEDEIDSMKKTTHQIQTSFQAVMEKKLGGVVDIVMNKFVDKIFTHLDIVTGTVMADRFGGYHPELRHLITYATSSVISDTKEKYSSQLLKMIECEKKTVYSVDPSYVVSLNKLKANHTRFSAAMRKQSMSMEIEGVGKADLKHLQKIADEERNQAFELKMKSTAYINVVIKRVVDGAALELRSMIENFVTGEMVTEIVNTILSLGDDIDHLFQTTPLVNADRKKIENNIALLLETKKQIMKVMDSITHY